MNAGKLDRLIRIEQRSVAKDTATGAELVTWVTLADVWASREDATNPGATEEYMRPGGLEVAGGISTIKIRWRADVDTSMRLNLNPGGAAQLRQIIGMAEIGRREGLKLSCREWSSE